MHLNAYLIFNGECEAAFKFYETTFGGTIDAMMSHAGTPMEKHGPAGWEKKILHANMRIGDTVLMASDAPPERYRKPQGFSVSIGLNDVAEAERIYKALSEGGTVEMALQQTFWAERFAMCTDRFGIPWMINCDMPDAAR